MKRRTTLLAGLLAAACVQAPAVQQRTLEIEPPERWSTTTGPGRDSQDPWWILYGDTQLSELIELGLAQNDDLRAAAFRVKRAVAAGRIAKADLKPSLGAGLSAQRQEQVFVGLPIPGGPNVLSSTSTQFALSLETSWEADLWGRLRAGARAALAEAQATEADLRGAQLSMSGQIAKLWFAVAEARQQLELTRRSVESFTTSTELVRSRYESGVRPSIDLRLALSNQHNAEALAAAAENALDAALRQLETLLGRYPSAELLDRYSIDRLPDLPPPVPVGLPSELVSRRPDLVAAERRLTAADQRVLVAQRSRYPRFAMTARGGSVSDQLGDLLDGDFGVWALVGNLTAPLFQAGRLKAGVEQARSAGDEALALYAGQVLRAYSEVETALAAEQHLRVREEKLRETAEQLEGAGALAATRYARGVGDYLTVLESQTRALNARIAWIRVRRELLTNRVDLHLALGGGFNTETVLAANEKERDS
ncbi:MAG: efflux transporter outer membrane subunit [Acidobacteria bacterium]|nr:efflux transporter outer membrane subunit [Acidobacteriota bacterium]NIM62317.1 efflux transporter outer membrane subunit [Acidobacteriota bacterium]NIO60650.1 efflux transporter outer membrane subunit [Acidobacteriota bacterium]NIQ85083.1 efflux transporter outer membrane subunit [Acidobacteriota bacterium]NIT12294.1 efflux transporter outer membrane subunit [Acidobacteriota bacterium]